MFHPVVLTLISGLVSSFVNAAPTFSCATSNCTTDHGGNKYCNANAGGNSVAAGFGGTGNASAPLFLTQTSAGGNSNTPALVPKGTTVSYKGSYPNGMNAQVLTGTTIVYAIMISRSGLYHQNGDSSDNPQLDWLSGQQPTSSSAIYNIYFSEAVVEFIQGLGSTNLWTAAATRYYQISSSSKSFPSTLSFGKAVYVTDTTTSPANWFCSKGGSTCSTVDPGFYANTTTLHAPHAGSFKSKADFTTWTTSLLQTNVIPWDPVNSVYVFVIQSGSFYKQDPNTPVVYPSSGHETLDCSVHDAAYITPFSGKGGILTYAIIGEPSDSSSMCYDRIQALTGLDPSTRSSAIKRLSVLNDIAHEILEMISNPIPYESWTATDSSGNLYEPGDLCRNVFLSRSSSNVQPNLNNKKMTYPWNIQLSNGHKYLVQAMWDVTTQSCVSA